MLFEYVDWVFSVNTLEIIILIFLLLIITSIIFSLFRNFKNNAIKNIGLFTLLLLTFASGLKLLFIFTAIFASTYIVKDLDFIERIAKAVFGQYWTRKQTGEEKEDKKKKEIEELETRDDKRKSPRQGDLNAAIIDYHIITEKALYNMHKKFKGKMEKYIAIGKGNTTLRLDALIKGKKIDHIFEVKITDNSGFVRQYFPISYFIQNKYREITKRKVIMHLIIISSKIKESVAQKEYINRIAKEHDLNPEYHKIHYYSLQDILE